MRKLKREIILIVSLFFSLIALDFTSENVSSLTFADAPTINDYVSVRGSSNLYKVLFGLSYHYFAGTQAADWNDLEGLGEKLSSTSTMDQIADFIFQNSFQVQLTKFGFALIMSQLRKDFPIVEKNYYDADGYYTPLNQTSVIARNDIYVDIADLFGAQNIFLTREPLANGYEYRWDGLYINAIEVTVNSARYARVADKLNFMIVESADRFSSNVLTKTFVDSTTVVMSRTAVGAIEALNYGRVAVEALDDVNSLLGAEIKVAIGNMTKTVKGLMTKELSGDIGIGKVLAMNPAASIASWDWEKIATVEKEAVVPPETGGGGGEGGLIDQILNALKQFFIPDFSKILENFSDFMDNLKDKFSFVFDAIDIFKNLFKSEKSLHDLTIKWLDNKTYYIFPRYATETFFINLKRVINVFVFLITLIFIYKKVTGEGDAIAI